MDESYSEYDFETLSPLRTLARLPFDANSLENIILTVSDHFNFRVVLGNKETRRAICIGTGLTIAGTVIGRQLGGKVGAAVGGALGGACGVGLVDNFLLSEKEKAMRGVVSLRNAWQDLRAQLSELFDIVYDYLANLGIEDYVQAAMFLAQHVAYKTDLAKLMLQIISGTLGKQVLSSLTA